jgi:hypothetical protein
MKYTYEELKATFRDFETSELIASLEQDESITEETLFSIDELGEEGEWYDSSGTSWAEQQAEARRLGIRAYSVADEWRTWYMGLVW